MIPQTFEIEPIVKRKVKIEINTREHFSVQPRVQKPTQVNNGWFKGASKVLTYTIEEIMATKLRALYQRKKGRDLYDMWYALKHIGDLNVNDVVDIFYQYMKYEEAIISRAEFEKNLSQKQNSVVFSNDVFPLLSTEQYDQYNLKEAFDITKNMVISKMKGEPWKVKEKVGEVVQ